MNMDLDKYSWYEFECDLSKKAEISVYAKSLEQAKEYINEKQWDEYEEIFSKIEDIKLIRVTKEKS